MVSDKYKLLVEIGKLLDNLGVSFIDGGWPGASPKEEEFFNHKISVSSGILAQESSELLKKFFQERRN